MRPLSHKRIESDWLPGIPRKIALRRGAFDWVAVVAICAISSVAAGCGGGGPTPPNPPPAQEVQVTVTPASSSVVLGNTTAFTATVTGSSDSSVTWSVNGIAGGSAATGRISAEGVYTAPADLPSPATVSVTATSHADAGKSASASLTVTSDIVLSVTPSPASVELGARQSFHAAVSSSGRPDTAVRWSVTGAACPNGCGAVDANGNYTAPQVLPGAPNLILTAQSVADPSKEASVAVTITSSFTLQLNAPATVPAGGTATIVATITPAPGSNPSAAVTWSVEGTGCSASGCGTITTLTTQSAGSGATSIADTATYNAPAQAPNPNAVRLTATAQADPSKRAQASIAIQPGAGVIVSPGTATLAANHRVTLTAQVNGASNTGVSWSLNGSAGGSASLGQLCAAGSSPCTPPPSGALQVDYVAPGAIPTANPVSVIATSLADATQSGSAQITVINHVVVSVLPGSVTLVPLGVQRFTASVLGTSNQSVVWQVQGAGCAGGACGSVNSSGTYTAPATPPSPNALQVVAVSSDDTSQSGAASVTISTGANILTLHAASVYAGAANGFTLRVEGSGFAASSPGPGSALLIGGTSRVTTCSSSLECSAPVTAADVANAGSVTVQAQNPDGTKSNMVALVIAAPNRSDEQIALTSGAPNATGKDIVVVEPTTAGVSSPGSSVDLNVAAIGVFATATNTCSLTGNPIVLMRPASGTSAADICLFSESGFDTSMSYTVSGPGDVTVIAKQPAGLGIIHLTLQVPASAAPGARTLFIQNTNLDKTAASGALEVQ